MTTLTPWKVRTIRCGKPKEVHSVIRKWINDKQNASVVGWVNNQAPTLGPTHEWRCAGVISERVSTKREANSYLCKWSIKESYN
jgi:hypothetical protein